MCKIPNAGIKVTYCQRHFYTGMVHTYPYDCWLASFFFLFFFFFFSLPFPSGKRRQFLIYIEHDSPVTGSVGGGGAGSRGIYGIYSSVHNVQCAYTFATSESE